MGRPGVAVLLLGAGLTLGMTLFSAWTAPVRADSFGCQIGLRQQPRIWIYTEAEESGNRLQLVRISETIGTILEELDPEDGRRAYSVAVVRNNAARRLIEDLDLLSCLSGKLLNVDVASRKILKFPEDPKSFTLLSFTFRLEDQSEPAAGEPVEMGPFRFLLPDPEDPKLLKEALSPVVAEGLAGCIFRGELHCQGGS